VAIVERLKLLSSKNKSQILSLDLKQAYDNVKPQLLLKIIKKRVAAAKNKC
jgi:hypothetical protein